MGLYGLGIYGNESLSAAGVVFGTGTPPRIAVWTLANTIGDGTWEFPPATDTIRPVTDGSDIGDATHQVTTLFIEGGSRLFNDFGTLTLASPTGAGTIVRALDLGNAILENQNTPGTDITAVSVSDGLVTFRHTDLGATSEYRMQIGATIPKLWAIQDTGGLGLKHITDYQTITVADKTATYIDATGFVALTDAVLAINRIPFSTATGVFSSNAGFVWDNATGRLGINVAIPTARLHVVAGSSLFTANGGDVLIEGGGNTNATQLRVSSNDEDQYFKASSGNGGGFTMPHVSIGFVGANPIARFGVRGSGVDTAMPIMRLLDDTNAVVMAVRNDDKNVGIGTETFGTNADTVMAFLSGTAPTTQPIDTFQMWGADVAGAGTAALHIMTEAGDTLKLYKVSSGWTLTNVTTDRVLNANMTNMGELADVLGTLITDLIETGIITT